MRYLLVFLIALTACGAAPPAPAGPASRAASVVVRNDNWSDVVVYALRLGTRQRLGSVVSMTTERLRLPPGVLAGGDGLRLMVDLIGSRETYTTEVVTVLPGDRVELRVQNHLAISSVSVWRR